MKIPGYHFEICLKCQKLYLQGHQCPEAGLPDHTEITEAYTPTDALAELFMSIYDRAGAINNQLQDLQEDVVKVKNFLGIGEPASDSKTPKSTSLRGQINQLDAKLETVRKNTRPLKDKILGKK